MSRAKITHLILNESLLLVGGYVNGEVVKVNMLTSLGLTKGHLKKCRVLLKKEEMENKLIIKTKYVVGSKVVACLVSIGGHEIRLPIKELYSRLRYLNCNYTVRQVDNDYILAGNKGYSENDIPSVKANIGVKDIRKPKLSAMNEKSSLVSFIGLIEDLKSVGGYVLLLKDTKYNALTDSTAKIGEKFVCSDIGEISEPNISFGQSLKCNLPFRKPGSVGVKLNSSLSLVEIPTYLMRTKTVFNGVDVNVDRLGIAFPSSYSKLITSKYKTIISSTITKDVKPLLSLVNKKDYIGLELDINKIELMNKEEAKNYILNAVDLNDTVVAHENLKLIHNKGKKILKKIEDIIGKETYQEINIKEVAGNLSPFITNEEDYTAVLEAGLDLKYGSYTQYENKYSSHQPRNDKATIEYLFELKDKTLCLSKSQATLLNEFNLFDKSVEELSSEIILDANKILAIKDKVDNSLEKIKREYNLLTEKLWYHKIASLIEGSSELIYLDKKWEKQNSRASKYSIYSNEKSKIKIKITSGKVA